MKYAAITSAYCTHHDKPAVSPRFEKDHFIISIVKTPKGAAWSQSRELWHIPHSDSNLSEIFDKLSSVALFTHQDEKGIDLRYIQEILGHSSSKATEIYIHVSSKQLGKIKDPLDEFG